MRHLILAAVAALALFAPPLASSEEISIRFQVAGIEEESIPAVIDRLGELPAVGDASFDVLGPEPEDEDAAFANGYFVVTLAQGHQLSLAELEQALDSAGRGARIDRGSVLLVGNCRLVFDGVSSPEDQERLMEAIQSVTGLEATSSGDLGSIDIVASIPEPPAPASRESSEGPNYSDEERKAMEELVKRAQENMRKDEMAPPPERPGVDLRLVMVSLAKNAPSDGESSGFELRDVVWSGATID